MIKNNIFKILIIAIIFIFGLSTGHYKHFPFPFFYKIKNIINKEEKSYTYHGRHYNITHKKPELDLKISNNSGIYLTYGQSNSANFGEIGYDVKKDVYHSFVGHIYEYKDPIIGSQGNYGSVWGMVGDKLINNGFHDKVIFSNCGWGSAKINQLNRGDYFGYLVLNYNALIKKFGRVDGILFHQGEADNNDSADNYYDEFTIFINNLKENGIEIPVYLSRASLCRINKPINKNLTDIQIKLINDYKIVKEGPNTDLLFDKNYRLKDYCHFSLLGFEKFSEMWIESIAKK